VKSEEGRGKREEGRGKREEGRGKREEGRAGQTIKSLNSFLLTPRYSS